MYKRKSFGIGGVGGMERCTMNDQVTWLPHDRVIVTIQIFNKQKT